jgi:PAS domain S-box-containing protein
VSEEKFRSISDLVQDAILIMDNQGNISYWNNAAEKIFGYSAQEAFGKKLHILLIPQRYQAAYQRGFRKFKTTGQGPAIGNTLEFEATRKDGTEIPVELSVSAKKFKGEWNSIGIIRDIAKHKRVENELKQTSEKLRESLEGIVEVMAATVELRDPYTAGHQRRVADLACAIATEMALSKDRIEGIHMAGIIHDIGKISIPAEILSKPGSLNEIEFSLIKEHSKTGYDLLKDVEFPWPIAQIVLQHHERIDGSGYPLGLSVEDILLEARILCVADVVEAMSSHRPYRPALGIDSGIEQISEQRGVLYDPEVVDACIKVVRERKYEFEKQSSYSL